MARYLYALYRGHSMAVAPSRLALRTTARVLAPRTASGGHPVLRRVVAASRVLGDLRLTHRRPEYDVNGLEVDGVPLIVTVEVADQTPFAELLLFRAAATAEEELSPRPKVLLVTALSGHFSTLLQPTLRMLLRDNDVYVTDWRNARDIPRSAGRFGFDEYVDHVIRFLRLIGSDVHVLAVCQPCPAVIAAVALLADDPEPFEPRSLTLMAGPVDARINPGRVNKLGAERSIDWFRDRCVTVVPTGYAGAGRRVYPGFLQVSAFMSLSPKRHVISHLSMYRHLQAGEPEKAAVARRFYDEYFAVLDVAAEFYLETVQRIFLDHDLPLGRLTHHGRPVRPQLIRKTPLLTVEAQRDELCPAGQTHAAHDLLSGLDASHHRHYVQEGVGHYGIFSGRRWEHEIYPVLLEFMRDSAALAAADDSEQGAS
jgi:poly(3-hydroxybutyrate) depolymerase